MKKKTFFICGFPNQGNWYAQAKDAAKVIPTIMTDMDQSAYAKLLTSVNSYKDTPLGTMFYEIVRANKGMYHMSFLSTPSAIPEILMLEQMSIIGAEASPTLRPPYDGVWNPLSTALKRDKSGYHISSENLAMEITVRSKLCHNFYHDSGMWLTPNDLLFMMGAYGEFISMIFGRTFRLSIQEEMPVKFIFAWYFALMCGYEPDNNGQLPIMQRFGVQMGIGPQALQSISGAFGAMYVEAEGAITVTHLLSLMKDFVPDRVTDMNEKALWSVITRISTNGLQYVIGVNYPPYFIANLLEVASVGRHTILTSLIKERNKPSDFMNRLRLIVKSRYLHD
jgi:hypothetical protein